MDSREPVQITMDATITTPPDIAATTSGYVVVWVEEGETGPRLKAVALTEKGNPGTVQLVAEEGSVDRSMPISVAAVGDSVVVVWSPKQQNQILAQKLNGNAEVDGEAQVVDEGVMCLDPKIAASDSGFMVTFGKQPFKDLEIFSRPLDINGVPTGDVNRITFTTVDADSPAVAWNGSSYAVAWISSLANGEERCAHADCNAQVFAAQLGEDGALSATPVQLSDDPNPASELELSWDGSGWTAVFELVRLRRQQVFLGRMVCD